MMRPLVFMFGGQSSRDGSMVDRLAAVDREVAARVEARAAVADENFDSNHSIQVRVHATTLGWLELAQDAGLQAVASAGLSLGEYAHLVDIGMMTADASMKLVERRGRLYDDGPAGVMAAVYPATFEELEPLLGRVREAHGAEAIAPAVFNSPTQTVFGGTREAVDELIAVADEELYAVGTIVEHRIPMHTPRFRAVAEPFAAALSEASLVSGARSYIPNVVGAPVDPEPEVACQRLAEHVWQPVCWRQTIDALVAAHPDAVFVEVGARTVLRDLMKRRWHRSVPVFALDEIDSDPAAQFARTLQEIQDA